MAKIEVTKHYDHGRGVPAVNVKVYTGFPTIDRVVEAFPGTTDEQAEKALEFAFQSAQESFWEYWRDADNLAHYFPKWNPEVYSGGRSGGWLEVHGIPDPEEWRPSDRKKWKEFVKDIAEDIKFRCEWEQVHTDIESNQWHKPHSGMYNFIGDGVCIADVRADVEAYVTEKYGAEVAAVIMKGGNE